jgi:hypothetical protein
VQVASSEAFLSDVIEIALFVLNQFLKSLLICLFRIGCMKYTNGHDQDVMLNYLLRFQQWQQRSVKW